LENRKVVFLPRDIHNRFIKEVMDDNQGTLEWGELKRQEQDNWLSWNSEILPIHCGKTWHFSVLIETKILCETRKTK